MPPDRSFWIEASLHALIVGTLFSAGLRDAATIALIGLIFAEWLRPPLDGDPGLPQAPLVGWFLLANLLAALRSDHAAVSLAALRFYPLGVLVYFATWRVVAGGGLPRLASVVSALVVALAVDVAWQLVTGTSLLRPRIAIAGRYRGSLSQPTDVSMLPILLPFAAVLPSAGAPAWTSSVVLSLVAVASAVSGTRAALVATLLATIGLRWVDGKRLAKRGALVLAIVLLTAALGTMTAPRRLFTTVSDQGESRLTQWRAAWSLFLESPIIGHGAHCFPELCAARAGQLGTAFAEVDLPSAPYPHQVYLETLSGAGLAGFAPFVALLLLPVRFALQPRAGREARAPALTSALFAFVALVDMSLKNDWVQLCFWLPIGCAEGLRSRGSLSDVAGEAPAVR